MHFVRPVFLSSLWHHWYFSAMLALLVGQMQSEDCSWSNNFSFSCSPSKLFKNCSKKATERTCWKYFWEQVIIERVKNFIVLQVCVGRWVDSGNLPSSLTRTICLFRISKRTRKYKILQKNKENFWCNFSLSASSWCRKVYLL